MAARNACAEAAASGSVRNGLVPLGPWVAVALVLGIGACLGLPRVPERGWLLCLPLVPGLLLWWRSATWTRLCGAAMAGFGLAGAHALWVLGGQLSPLLELRDVIVVGEVVELPRHESRRTRFMLDVAQAHLPDADSGQADAGAMTAALQRLQGRRLQLAWYDPFRSAPDPAAPRLALQPGEHWEMRVRLRAPRGLRNPGGFDAERHAFARRIAATGSVRIDPQPLRLGQDGGIDAWRHAMSVRIDMAVPSDSARYVRALALGDVNGLSEQDWNALRAIGLTHLIAISGFHVGVVAGFFALWARALWWCLPALGRAWPRPLAAGATALAGAALYTALVGFELPTVRTTLMIAVVVLARCSRRHHRAVDALALAAISMVLVDPLSVLAPGFWLSFLGVAWLLWCLPGPSSVARGWADTVRGQVRDLVQAQGVASLGLLPLTVLFFGQASLAGPLANLVAVPWWSLVVVPLSLLGTFCEALFVGSGTWLWRLAAWCFDLSWPGFLWLAESPFALWWPARAPWTAFLLAMSGALWLLLPRGLPGRGLALCLLLPLLWPRIDRPAAGEVDLVVLDVGQGSALLVRTAGHALLYDMGPAIPDGWDAGERAVLPALRALGVRHLDLAMTSHDDLDHAGGWEAVRRMHAGTPVLAPPGSSLEGAQECLAGGGWHWDGVHFEILHPTPFFPYMGNDSSCVLRIRAGGRSALLAGDIGEVIEARLGRLWPDALRNDVVLVGHHGSRHSSSAAFVEATRAGHALVSRGHGNRFGHPHAQVMARWASAGAEVQDTARAGTVRLRLGPEGIAVATERQAHPRLWDAVARAERARPR